MLNFIWAFMILAGILYAALSGNLISMTEILLDSAGEAISLCLSMAGVVGLWMGLMEIAQQSGLVSSLSRGITPLLNLLFPNIPKEHKAREYIATNLIANFLGLGWACTPAGLKAMEQLHLLEQERGNQNTHIASREMCTFLVMNISSLQLIPVNMIAYRQQYGSVDPAGIILPAILATCGSSLVAICFCKALCAGKDRRLKG
ncbi:MAG: nucleoside recognition protein [Lachnospiraceae bacterium]|nr:nucleoside recognition protein [Lachnospiraceae bacterium]